MSDAATPWRSLPAYQAPPSMGFSKREYWSGGAVAYSISDVAVLQLLSGTQ